jgi:hypothetical protein
MMQSYLWDHLRLGGWDWELKEDLQVCIIVHGVAGHEICNLEHEPVEKFELAVTDDFLHDSLDQTLYGDQSAWIKCQID